MYRLKGTETLGNLMKAFAGESQAISRYRMFASVAEKEGHPLIGDIFLDTAENERQHANNFYRFIAQDIEAGEILNVNVNSDYPVEMGDTVQNLHAAAAGEHEEFTVLYNNFGDIAIKEGFRDIGFFFHGVAKIESEHEERYLAYAAALSEGTLYKAPNAVEWRCKKCGHMHVATSAPNICPICSHPKGFFELFVPNWKTAH